MNTEETPMLSTIYQAGFTLFFIVLFLITAVMTYGYIKENKPFIAGGNFLLACFCFFAVLVRFGLISATN